MSEDQDPLYDNDPWAAVDRAANGSGNVAHTGDTLEHEPCSRLDKLSKTINDEQQDQINDAIRELVDMHTLVVLLNEDNWTAVFKALPDEAKIMAPCWGSQYSPY